MAVQDPQPQPQPTNPTVQRLIKAAAAGQAAKAAAGAAVAPAVAVTLPARAAVGAIAVPVEAFAHGVKIAIILRALRALLKRTHADSADWLTKELRKQFPNADPAVIREAVERELKFEEAFQQKALVRVEADLHKASTLPTPAAQQKRVNAILAREKHYAELREKAMLNRAKGHVQNAGIKAISPNGAKWMLGQRKNHTLGCLALAGKNWPWEVLDTIAPPLHSNCGCELKPLGPTDTVPPVGDAMAMAKAAMALEEAIRAVAAPGEVDLYLAGRALLEASGESLQEVNWSEWLHPRGRGGKWMDKLEPKPEHEPKEPKEPHEPKLPKEPKPDPHMPELSPESTVVSGPKPEGEKILGGDVPEPAHQGPIPSFDHIPLKLQLPPAFGADHIKAKGGDQNYLVKDHGGDRAQVARELLSNAVYRELGVDVPTMGHIKTAPEPDFEQRAEDLPKEPTIDAAPGARISTGIILREPDGRMTLIEPRNHYGGYIHTFPKGGVEPTLTPQQNAHKELWEETGLHAHITGVVGDFKGDTGVSRYYVGVRTGGEATPSDETQAIKTVTPDEAAQMLNKQRDQDVLKALLEQPIPKGTYEDAFPPESQGSALAVPTVDGKTKEISAPNEALGRGYMADALLGNRNFLGQRGENVRWPNDNTPVRTNMGSTLGYGARGKHEFGNTPEEVWTMRTRGQAAGTVPQGEDELRQQASDIAKILTNAKVDELVNAAPFPDPKERKALAKALKARVAWMRRFADGSESLPTPASGAEARAQFADAQSGFEIYPEERQAMEEYGGDAGRTLDGRLTSGKNFTDGDRKLAKRLDAVLEASRAPVDSHVYVGAPGEPKAGMVGKTFSMKPYIRAHSEMTNAKGQMRMRLLVPGDARALHLEDAAKGEPDMLLPRGQRVHVTGMRTGPDGVPQLDGIVMPYHEPPRIPSDWKPSGGYMGQTTIAGLKPKTPKEGTPFFKKGDRVDVNGNKATVTGDAGKGMANVKTDNGKGYTVPFSILKRLEEADYAEALHPRGRGGKWIGKFDTSKLEKTQTKGAATAAEGAIRQATGGGLAPFKLTQLPDDDSATARSRRGNEIALHEDSAPHTQASAIVHEYAHGIDRMRNEDDWFTQTPAFQPLYKALMASPTVKKLKADEVELMKGDDRGRAQLLQGRELFARAFEQYVAERGGNEMLRERMSKLTADPLLGFQHWQADEFKPIAAEMEKALGHIRSESEKGLEEAGSVADFREWLHPRGRGGKWIEGTHREAPAAATAIKAITSPSAPPVKESVARIEALGISVVPPGKKSKFSNQEIADIADVIEEATKQYPVLSHGAGAPLRRVEFTSGGHGKLKPGVLADTGIRPASKKQAGWNIPTGSNISVLRFNDSYGYGLKPAGPPKPGTQTGGPLAPSSSSWAGVAWHELGHALMNAIDMAGHHDQKRYVDWMARYGVTFDDCKGVSTYSVASRSEGIAELCSMENTPGYSSLLSPELEGKAHQMFEDLRNWDVGTPYAYQKPLIANPKPTPKIKTPPAPKVKATPTLTPTSTPTPTYAMPPPGKLAEIEASVKASPGVAGVKMPVAEMDLKPGDVFEGGTPGLRYLVIADPSEKNGLRYVPLNQGKANAYRFSSTSKRRKVDLHFELQEGQMTLDISPETQRKINQAAAANLEAGDWVVPDPLLDQNDPAPSAVQESVYTEALHPRGRGGKWIGKGMRPKIAAPHAPEPAPREPAPARVPGHAALPKSPVDAIVGSLGGKRGDEAYQALASGAATDTQKIHQVDGKYTEARQMLHQHVVDHFFANAKPAEGKARAIFTAGGAASGKSALAGQASDPGSNLDIPEGAVYINPDDIKAMLPEYDMLKAQGREDIAAAATHEESSDLAKLMTGLAMEGNYPIIVDGTGDSKVGKFGGKLKAAADAGYHVEARYAHVPVEEAVAREAKRAERTGRKVATSLLREQHRTVAQSYVQDVAKMPGVHVKVYSTVERGKPKLIAEKRPDQPINVVDKQQYSEHLAKAEA